VQFPVVPYETVWVVAVDKDGKDTISIPIATQELTLVELEVISCNCEEMFVDGDGRCIVVVNPNDILIEELESRGIWKK